MPSFRASAVSGVKWTGADTIATTLLQYGQLVVLARLLQPSDFGLAGMVIVVIGFSQAFVDMGMGNAVIWKQDASQDQLSSLYWLNIIAGIFLFGIIVLVSPLVSRFYNEPALKNMVILSACTFLIIPIGQQFQMLLQKELLFKRLAVVNVTASVVGVTVAITTAALDCGAYSLIYGQLANSICGTALLVWMGWSEWRPGLHFRFYDLRDFIGFGFFQMGTKSLNYFMTNIDYIIVGRVLGSSTLGIYMLAYQMVVMPLNKINPILTRVAFPIFAKKQKDDSALSRGYIELSKVIALVSFPVLAILAATASVLIPLFFGANWEEAVPLVQILSLLGVLRALNNPSGSVLLAKGRADILFFKNIFIAGISTVAFWLAAQHGAIVMAWSEVCVTALWFIANLIILRIIINMKPLEYLSRLASPFAICACTGMVVYAFHVALDNVMTNNPLQFGILITVGVALYSLLVWLTEKTLISEYWGYFRGKDEG